MVSRLHFSKSKVDLKRLISNLPTQPEDLSNQEQSLFEVWWHSRKLGVGRFNSLVTIACALVLFAYLRNTHETSSDLANRVRSWSDLGISFATSILGFLIAGFTVFATITKPELFIKMAQTEYAKYHIDYLRYSSFSFLQVFIHYMVFLGTYFAIKMLGAAGGPVNVLLDAALNALHHNHWLISVKLGAVKWWLSRSVLLVAGAYFAYVLLLLKSFVWNVYDVTRLSIQWSWIESKKVAK